MTISRRRTLVMAIFLTITLCMTLLAGVLTKMDRANAGAVCHTSVKAPRAPSVVWPMVSQFPATRSTAMGSDWIDPLHRPGGGYQISGTFRVNVTMEYHWCIQGSHPTTTGLVKPYRTQIC